LIFEPTQVGCYGEGALWDKFNPAARRASQHWTFNVQRSTSNVQRSTISTEHLATKQPATSNRHPASSIQEGLTPRCRLS